MSSSLPVAVPAPEFSYEIHIPILAARRSHLRRCTSSTYEVVTAKPKQTSSECIDKSAKLSPTNALFSRRLQFVTTRVLNLSILEHARDELNEP